MPSSQAFSSRDCSIPSVTSLQANGASRAGCRLALGGNSLFNFYSKSIQHARNFPSFGQDRSGLVLAIDYKLSTINYFLCDGLMENKLCPYSTGCPFST